MSNYQKEKRIVLDYYEALDSKTDERKIGRAHV